MIESYEEFRDLFLGHYWEQSRQSEIRYQIMNGKYDSKRNGTMAEYFIVMGQQARFLDPVVPIGEFIGLMANHYPLDVRSAIIVSKPQGPKETIKLLKELQPSTKSGFVNLDNRPKEGNAPIKKSEQAQNILQEGAGSQYRSNQAMGSRPYAGPPPKNNYHPQRNSNQNYQKNNRINFIGTGQDQQYQGNIPHWFKRIRYQGRFWRPKCYSTRFQPYPDWQWVNDRRPQEENAARNGQNDQNVAQSNQGPLN